MPAREPLQRAAQHRRHATTRVARSSWDAGPRGARSHGGADTLGRAPAFDFDDISVFASDRAGAGARTRGSVDEEYIATANGAGGAPVGTPPAGSAPAVPNTSLRCAVATGPTYSVSGAVPRIVSGTRQRFPFHFDATFVNLSPTGKLAGCCEVHQFIKWDSAFLTSHGGKPPHSGFPASWPAGTWIEDRDTAGTRYGHRTGALSAPSTGDEYTTRGTRDQAFGDAYHGNDAPERDAGRLGQFQFRLDAVDCCNANAVKASSSVISVNFS